MTMMSFELARRIEEWVQAQEPQMRLQYDDQGGSDLIVLERRPVLNTLGSPSGKRSWQEVGRYASLLAFAEAKGITAPRLGEA